MANIQDTINDLAEGLYEADIIDNSQANNDHNVSPPGTKFDVRVFFNSLL